MDATAATLTVGPAGPYFTIQAAVDAASDGDRIEVQGGTYTEAVTIAKDVDVIGLSGAGATTITSAGRVVYIRDSVGATLSGFSVTGGTRGVQLRAATATLSDLIVSGHSGSDGAGVYISQGSNLAAIRVQLSANTATGRGAHLYAHASSLLLDSCTLTGGTATHGGGIYLTGGVTALLRDSTVVGNSAVSGVEQAYGGGIRALSSNLTIRRTTFDNNDAETGGNIASFNGTVLLDEADLVFGTARRRGGGLYASTGTVDIRNSRLTDNAAVLYGGGAYFIHADATLDGVTIADNRVTDVRSFGGGAHFTGTSSLMTVGGSLLRNTSAWVGGGLRLGDSTSADVMGTLFEGNTAVIGGAVHSASPSTTLDGATLRDNTAEFGGAVRWSPPLSTGTFTSVDSLFVDNIATALGGAIYAHDGGDLVLEDSGFAGNQARSGGGLYLQDVGAVTALRNGFCANTATEDGGAAWSGRATVSETWASNAFVENTAADDGGALVLTAQVPATVRNNHFLGNAAADGGGLFARSSGVTFASNLVAWTQGGGGLHAAAALPDASVRHNHWFANSASDLAGAQTSWGPYNGTGDPVLGGYTLDGDCTNDDLVQRYGSPLVDAGDPALLDPDGTSSDIGAVGGPDSVLPPFADADTDLWIQMFDCADDDPAVHPLATEIPGNGTDEDCDGWDRCDGDLDGVAGPGCGGADCDDANAAVQPGAVEVEGDGIDQDCDGNDYLPTPTTPFEITIRNQSSFAWDEGVVAAVGALHPQGGGLLKRGAAPLVPDALHTFRYAHTTCDAGGEDDGDAALLISRWSDLSLGSNAWVVPPLGPGASHTLTVDAMRGEVLTFAAHVSGTPDDAVLMHAVGDPSDPRVELFNAIGMPLWEVAFDIGGYDVGSRNPFDGTDVDCALTCPTAPGCHTAYGNGSVGPEAGGDQPLPPPPTTEFTRWSQLVLGPTPGTFTENGLGSPAVVHRKLLGDFVMFFESRLPVVDPNCPVGVWGIGVARSTDGWNWTVDAAPLITPIAGTYASCVAAHPTAVIGDDGATMHLWFKGEQGTDACDVTTPPWGCEQYTGVGYAHVDAAATGLISVAPQPYAQGQVFGFPTVTRSGSSWVMLLGTHPDLYLATAPAPEGPWTASPTPVMEPGVALWAETELYNPALACEGDAGPPPAFPYTNFFGGRRRATTWGPVLEAGLGKAISADALSWLISSTPFTFAGTTEWRHWDVTRVGGAYLLWFAELDASGKNHIGVAGTTDQLAPADIATKLCPQPGWW